MVAITNTTSLTFLKEAIDATLTEAETSLEAFSDDPSRQEELARCAEDFQQLRGICQVVELPAAALMSEEMALAARELREKQSDARVQALSNAIVLLTRYFDYVQLKNRTLPALLIGGINELRRAGGNALIQESHFFRADLARPPPPPLHPHHATGFIDLVNGQEGAQTLLQTLILVTTGLRVVQADFKGFGIHSSARQQQQTSRKEYFSDVHSGWPPELQRQWGKGLPIIVLIIC